MNFLFNAIQYSVKDNGAIVVEATIVDGQLRIEILDCGSGVEEEERSEMFSPGCRGSSADLHKEGAGYGLAISR